MIYLAFWYGFMVGWLLGHDVELTGDSADANMCPDIARAMREAEARLVE